MALNAYYWGLANKTSAISGVPANFIYAQWAHETMVGGVPFSSRLVKENNNLGGYTQETPNGEGNKQPDGNNYYREFKSQEEYAEFYGERLKKDYPGIQQAATIEEYSAKLKEGKYYGETYEKYTAGMKDRAAEAGIPVTSSRSDYRDAGSNPTGAGTTTSSTSSSSSSSSSSSASSSGTYSGNPDSIMDFVKFISTKAFTKGLRDAYESNLETTLQDFLVRFISKFYHNMYYIPTLHNNYCIVVKPECMFVAPPSCNVLYPQMRYSMSFSRNHKSEPTRAMLKSNPIGDLFQGEASAGQASGNLHTLVFMDLEGTKEVVKGIGELPASGYGKVDLTKPLLNVSKYEDKYGVRSTSTNAGADLYLYMLAQDAAKNAKGELMGFKGIAKDSGVAAVLYKLAKYFLLRSRYEKRPGNAETIFNPYIVPGFPMVSIDGSAESSLNVYAYVTDVVHSLSPNAFTTSISFNCTHIDSEPAPEMFPIVEPAYMKSDPYPGLIGGGVKAVMDIKKVRKDWEDSDTSVSTALTKVWRPMTTLEEHMKGICDNPKLNTDKTYVYYTGGFFDSARQKKIMAYVDKIHSGTAFSETEVR